MNLKERLLASIEVHGKSDISGVLNLYSHEKKTDIFRSLITLKNEGWVKLRKTQVIDGIRYQRPNVSRTSKQYFSQQKLF